MPSDDLAQSLRHCLLLSDKTLHHIDGKIKNGIHQQCYRTVNRLHALRNCHRFLHNHSVERVKRHRQILDEQFQELQSTLMEQLWLWTFHIKRPNH